MTQTTRRLVLDGGVRLLTEEVPHALSASIGVWIETGARHEGPREEGISHFTEHLLFKGTRRRSARQIALALESVGGYLDAFTGREQTCYYAHVLPEHLPRAVEVLGDLLRNALFRGDHVRREREVIADEIKTFEDTPEEMVHDLFATEVWRGHPLGNQILGTIRSVRGFAPGLVRAYHRRRYTADRVVVAAAGAIRPAAMRRLVERTLRFADGGAPDLLEPPPPFEPSVRVFRRDLSQEYLCIGGVGLPFASRERYAALLLNTLLGGGTSSRLFQRVREQRGLAYSIYSFADFCADSGLFGTFAATLPDNAETVVDLVLREYRRMLRDGLTRDELQSAKRQLRGGLLFSLESVENRMMKLARAELYGQRFLPAREILRRIDGATRDDVMAAAARLIDPERQTLVAMGPVSERRLRRVL